MRRSLSSDGSHLDRGGRPLAAALAALLVLGCGPLATLPGGALSGTERPVPTSWDFTREVDTVQLETRPSEPYSVNVWCVAVDGELYVGGSRESAWTANVIADPRVRLRVGRNLFALRAVQATSDAAADAFLAATAEKYGVEIDPDRRAEAILFRLEPRD